MKSATLLTIFVLCCILHDSYGRGFSAWKKGKKNINDGPNKLSPVIFSEFSTAFLLFSFYQSFSCFVLHCVSFTLLFSPSFIRKYTITYFYGCYSRDSRMLQLIQLSHAGADAYNGNWAIYVFVWLNLNLVVQQGNGLVCARSIDPKLRSNFFFSYFWKTSTNCDE